MYSNKVWSNALGQVAKNSVKPLSTKDKSDRRIAQQTYLVIKQTIEDMPMWSQAETRDVKLFKDRAGATWRLAITNKNARLFLALSRDASPANNLWTSQVMEVGGLVRFHDDSVGFALTADFSHFVQWRMSVMRERPVSNKLPSKV